MSWNSREKAQKTPGGEPLWRALHDPAEFASACVQTENVKTGGSRELPIVLLLPSDVR